MDETTEEATAVVDVDDAAAPTAPPPEGDPTNRVLSWAAFAIAALSIVELAGTMTVGLAVDVKKMSFLDRQGYAFLTNLEKSPVGLALIVAAVFAAIALYRQRAGDQTALTTLALWGVVVAAAVLGIGTILSVMARFRVAQLVATQPVDSLTRRVLVVFVVRNFGAAVAAILIGISALFRPTAKSPIA